MILHEKGVTIVNGQPAEAEPSCPEKARRKTLAWRILDAHDTHSGSGLHIRFDSITSHDITYVGIIQTARASGMKRFPLPYVLTNCHNTLCAVGGTINEDDHAFALSAARKYGGIYVPPCLAVIHSYNREMMSGCGRMILGSDSHTRYGALGTMGIGEGGGELAKQLVGFTYDIPSPEVVLVYLRGRLRKGVGPHDVALALCAAVYENGYVRNRVLEFAGPGICTLSQECRNAIDVMTTETTCLSSIWETDGKTESYFRQHHRPEAYQRLSVQDGAYYEKCIEIDLSEIECMIALPMHPSLAVPIHALKKDPVRILREAEQRAEAQMNGDVHLHLSDKVDENGLVHLDQGIIAGCSGGTYENIYAAAKILRGCNTGCGTFRLSVYPDSMPVYKALIENGCVSDLITAGAVFREAFCGPCFGAGDTPANGEFSIRHTTRNFPNREGSKPAEGQIASVALMDARSIAATAAHGGILTAADEIAAEDETVPEYDFDASIYEKRVYNGWQNAMADEPLRFGPNIKDWPEQTPLSEDLLFCVVSHIDDPVTTTDELIPSGETSSYRSNPLRLARFTLSRRDPLYVGAAERIQQLDESRRSGILPEEAEEIYETLRAAGIDADPMATVIGSAIFARKPGDGSAREQAASCQRVLGASANIALEYATKRYRSNLINWGMIPFESDEGGLFGKGTWVYVHGVRRSIENGTPFEAYAVKDGKIRKCRLTVSALNQTERDILLAGSLINYYKSIRK